MPTLKKTMIVEVAIGTRSSAGAIAQSISSGLSRFAACAFNAAS
jgi:hypothetical protein